MKKLLTLCFLSSLFFHVTSQNLVPNNSFEDFFYCPQTYGEVERAIPWFKPSAGTSDYFNGCCPSGLPVSVPVNYTGGYQMAHTGVAYMGLVTYKESYPNYREYISVRLLDALIGHQCYYFEMSVNLKNTAKYATNMIGVYFGYDSIASSTAGNLSVAPQISNTAGVINDTLAWTRVSGFYTAMGGERYITIGNFYGDNNTTYMSVYPGSIENYAYYYIDDVVVLPNVLNVDLGPDTSLCVNDSLVLSMNIPNAEYLWQNDSTDSVFVVREAGVYWVRVTVGGCSPTTDTIKVSYIRPPQVDLGNDTIICEGRPLILNATSDEAAYFWQDGSENPVFSVRKPGEYWVEVSNRCASSSDTIRVDFEDCMNYLYVPDAFTPNGDGINDVFLPDGSNITQFHMYIYNRWGQLIFESLDLKEGWDGTFMDSFCAPGVYFYVIYYSGEGPVLLDREGKKYGYLVLCR